LVLNHNVTILAELGNEALHVTGNTDQLMQVFTNLFENAVKYGRVAQSAWTCRGLMPPHVLV